MIRLGKRGFGKIVPRAFSATAWLVLLSFTVNLMTVSGVFAAGFSPECIHLAKSNGQRLDISTRFVAQLLEPCVHRPLAGRQTCEVEASHLGLVDIGNDEICCEDQKRNNRQVFVRSAPQDRDEVIVIQQQPPALAKVWNIHTTPSIRSMTQFRSAEHQVSSLLGAGAQFVHTVRFLI